MMDKNLMISADELAVFMNDGWPGAVWFLSDYPEDLWETTFTCDAGRALYAPRRPGALVNLYEFDGRVSWQGVGRDATHGSGHKLSVLFLRWQRTRSEVVVVVYFPREKLVTVTGLLTREGCLLVSNG